MDDQNKMIIKKEGFFNKIITKIKMLFSKKSYDNNEINDFSNHKVIEANHEFAKNTFENNLKVTVDTESFALKVKLENGEIKAIDLTDEQIDKLQAIYDKEIQEKKIKLEKLKQSA